MGRIEYRTKNVCYVLFMAGKYSIKHNIPRPEADY